MSEAVPALGIAGEGIRHEYSVGLGHAARGPLTFKVSKGEVLVIAGPSGCGKSTLLRILAGLLGPTEGLAKLDGGSPTDLRKRGEIGIAFQDPGLLPWRDVSENILLPFELSPRAAEGRNDGHGRLEGVLELTRLESYRNFLPHQLSGGLRQRVAVARALVTRPGTLLLDEPFGSLDVLTRMTLALELSRVLAHAKTTTVLVTHNVEEGMLVGNRMILLSARPGRILETIELSMPYPRGAELLSDSYFISQSAHARATLMKAITDVA